MIVENRDRGRKYATGPRVKYNIKFTISSVKVEKFDQWVDYFDQVSLQIHGTEIINISPMLKFWTSRKFLAPVSNSMKFTNFDLPGKASLEFSTTDLDFLPSEVLNFSLQGFLDCCRLLRSIT